MNDSTRRFGLLALAVGAVVAVPLGVYTALPWWGIALAAVNVAVFALYGYDKRVAGKGSRRVPEFLLHLLALAGGTPAAFAGQRLFRHKTQKRSFRVVFWLTVALQLVAIGYFWAQRRGAAP